MHRLFECRRAETIVVVVGHNADQIREHLKNAPVDFAFNPDPSSEMGESIRCGVQMLPASASATLVALVDHPAVPPEVVKTVIDEWRRGAQLIIPTWQERGGHPVLVDLCWRRELETLDTAAGLKSFFQKHADAVRRLPVGSEYIARDIDKWDDYVRLHSDVFGQAPRLRTSPTAPSDHLRRCNHKFRQGEAMLSPQKAVSQVYWGSPSHPRVAQGRGGAQFSLRSIDIRQ